MERVINNTIIKGIVIENIKNDNKTYDGIVKTSNGNKYYYFNNNVNLNIDSQCEFNISTTNRFYCDFEAVNIKILI